MWSVLIADDELIECQALELMLRNNYRDVNILPYAHDGLECVRMAELYEPDILLADINMPEFNGIEAISYLKKKNFQGKIIMITAYSKFTYIQDALRAGVEDYILKPVKVEELCRAVNKIRNKDIQEEEKQNAQISEIKRTVKEQILQSLYHADSRVSDFNLLLSMDKKSFCGMFLIIGTSDISLGMEKEQMHFLTERMNQYAFCFGEVTDHRLMMIVLADASMNQNEEIQFINSFVNILEAVLKKEFGILMKFAASGKKKTKEEIDRAYKECMAIFEEKETESSAKSGSAGTVHDPFAGIAEDCKECIRKKDKEKCQKLIRHLTETQNFATMDFEDLKIFSFHFLYHLSEIVYSGEQHFRTYILQNMMEWKLEEKHDLEHYLMNGTEAIFSLEDMQENNLYVVKAILYMEKEFKKNFALADLAEAAGISQFYMSRLFKQEFDMNFTEILTMIRLGKAIDMIETSALPVRMIAEESGFLSTSYFYRILKKKFDISVSRMRELFAETTTVVRTF